MVNYLIYPTIDDEHGFPPEVNRAIANAPEVSDATSLLINNPSNPIRQRLDILYTNATSPGADNEIIDGGSP